MVKSQINPGKDPTAMAQTILGTATDVWITLFSPYPPRGGGALQLEMLYFI